MEIIERRENPLLDRVEISFQWDHPDEPTPSLSMMIDAAAKSEPGANKDLVFVKNVDTRFGMSRTSGMALIYGSSESASIEPLYVKERHKSQEETPVTEPDSPDPNESNNEEEENTSEEGGESNE